LVGSTAAAKSYDGFNSPQILERILWRRQLQSTRHFCADAGAPPLDNVVTTPKALKLNTDQVKFGETLADWLAKKLNGKGNVIMVTGVAGTFVDQDRNKGAENVWSRNPGIKVVSRYTGMWDSSVAERNTAAVLNSLPQIDGIWCQGGTDGVLKALLAAASHSWRSGERLSQVHARLRWP
jgi:ABC-type sugar transport system substrate-binding protein